MGAPKWVKLKCRKCNKFKNKKLDVHCKCWKPTKKTEKVIKILEEYFRIDCTIEEACSEAWISAVSYHDWMNKDKEFAKRMERARNYFVLVCRKSATIGAKDDPRLAVDILKRRDKRYSEKIETENINHNFDWLKIEWLDEESSNT